MAKAMRYYKSKNCLMLKGSDETANFTEFWNNLFDNLNRNLPWQGLKIDDSEGFQVKLDLIILLKFKYIDFNFNKMLQNLKDALYYIDCWENEMLCGNISTAEFLTNQTAEGLRVTLNSTIDLSKYLLET